MANTKQGHGSEQRQPVNYAGIRCEHCGSTRLEVLETRRGVNRIIRNRLCLKCKARKKTIEQ